MFGRGMGLSHPKKNQMWNATQYKYIILLLEIAHDSEKNNQNQEKI